MIWILALMVLDELAVIVPISEVILLIVVLFRPRWFLDMVHGVYAYVPHRRAWRSVGDVCRREVVTVTEEMTVAEAAKIMRDEHVGCVVVVAERLYTASAAEIERPRRLRGRKRLSTEIQGGADIEKILVPVGILTDRDITLRVEAENQAAHALKVAEVMTREIEVVGQIEDVYAAVERMREAGARRLPVVDQRGALAGILTLDDLIAMFSQGLSQLVELLEQEVQKETASVSKSRP
ncbi:MAG: CBS domain-containing protein [Methylohalobius sp.]|nr:CBS domain-containing protein [Methylohalobius sp.]